MITNKGRAYKNMATANVVFNTTSTTHNESKMKQITQKFKTASFPHRSIYPNAESSNT